MCILSIAKFNYQLFIIEAQQVKYHPHQVIRPVTKHINTCQIMSIKCVKSCFIRYVCEFIEAKIIVNSDFWSLN